jgi:hypothetical protein
MALQQTSKIVAQGAVLETRVCETSLVQGSGETVVTGVQEQNGMEHDLYDDAKVSNDQPAKNEDPALDPVELKISYLGCAERCDEWVAISSPRLKPLNSASGSRRGDEPIRPEVKHLIKPIPVEGEEREYVVRRDPGLISPYYVKVVQIFFQLEGVTMIIHVRA